MSDVTDYDLVVVGMGSAGMVAAEFAAGLGVKVAVVERARVGGDRLWSGAVPAEVVRASARAAHAMRHADAFGLDPVEPIIDTARVWDRVRSVQGEIAASDDDPERFADMGVEVIAGEARLTGEREITVPGAGSGADRVPGAGSGVDRVPGADRVLAARFVLVCTGSRPDVPDLPGLDQAGCLTSETLFGLDRAPASVVILGGGPTGVELGQALARLGCGATVLEAGPRLLPDDEPELVDLLRERLVADGVTVAVGVEVEAVERHGELVTVRGRSEGDGTPATWTAAAVLAAGGRRPNVEGLGLDDLGVEVTERGIDVDERMRSSLPWLYAAGDVAGRYLFTHSAAYEAVRAVRDMFLPGRGRATDAVPWCTFTDPELAHTGMTVAEAEARHGEDVEVWRQDLVHSDRARADGTTDGAIVVVTVKGRIVGGHILAPSAGEMIHELALAIREGVSLSSLGGLVHVYPTLSTGIHQLAGEAAFERAGSFRWLVRRGRR